MPDPLTSIIKWDDCAIKCRDRREQALNERTFARLINPKLEMHLFNIMCDDNIATWDKELCSLDAVTIEKFASFLSSKLKDSNNEDRNPVLTVIVMPFIPGIDGYNCLLNLAHLYTKKPSNALLIWFITFFIKAISCAKDIHSRNVVHGDWRPGNCMLRKFHTATTADLQDFTSLALVDDLLQLEAIDAEYTTNIGSPISRCDETAAESFWPAARTISNNKIPNARPIMDHISFLRMVMGSGSKYSHFMVLAQAPIKKIFALNIASAAVSSHDSKVQNKLGVSQLCGMLRLQRGMLFTRHQQQRPTDKATFCLLPDG